MHYRYTGDQNAANLEILRDDDGAAVPPRHLTDDESKHFGPLIRRHIKHATTPLYEEIPDKPADPAKDGN